MTSRLLDSVDSVPHMQPHLKKTHSDKISPEAAQNGYIDQFQNTSSLYFRRVTANPVTTPSGNSGLFKDSAQILRSNVSGKRVQSDRDDGSWNVVSSDDQIDISWSSKEKAFAVEDGNADGLRWRTDETSNEEEEQSPERAMGKPSSITPMTGRRRGRFARR